MKLNSFFAASALLAGGAGILTAGEITGKVSLKGTPPPEPGLTQKTDAMKANPDCGKLSTEPKNRVFKVGAAGELAQVLVRLVGNVPAGAAVRTDEVVIDQKGCEYFPYISAAQVGQKLKVRNSDPCFHNVRVVPKGSGNKESNQSQLAGAPDISYTHEKPEDFLTYECSVHPWMKSYVTIMAHPFFDVSAADGSFTIKNVPDGKYQIEAIHRRAGKVVQDIEVKGGKATAAFELTVPVAK